MSETYTDDRYPLSPLTGRILKAVHEVYHSLGPGFMEVIYQRALAIELQHQGLAYEREVWIDIAYKGEKVGRKRVDFVIGDESGDVMMEIKAKGTLEAVDFVQALSYLKASRARVGLLLNFGSAKLDIKRFVN